MKYALNDEERKRRRAETAAMTKCPCGNVAGHGATLCGRCVLAQEQEKEALDANQQMQALLDVVGDEYASPLARAEATADALRMIWEKIT